MPHTTVAAVVLNSRSEEFVRRAALAALASLCRPVIVVAETNRVRNEVAGLPVDVIGERSESAAVRLALETALASTPHLDAAVFLRADQPYVTAGSIRHLLDAFQRYRCPIAAAGYEHTVGLPALFSRFLFPELSKCAPGCTLKQLIENHFSDIAVVPMPEAAAEIDSLADFAAYRR